MKMQNLFAAALSLGIALVSSNAFAAAWVPPSGSTSTFSYANGGDGVGLFGSPTDVSPDGFDFQPINFRAFAFGGVTTIQSRATDQLYVTLTATNGAAFNTITLNELIDYSIDNGGGVKAYAFLSVRVLDANYGPTTVFTGDDVFIIPANTLNAEGSVTLDPTVTLPRPASRIQISLNNTLHANSATNGTATIEKKLVGLDFVIPEPTTLTVFAAGISLLVARRRTA